MIEARNLAKTFTLHNRGGIQLPVFSDVNLKVDQRECVVLAGPSGAGKSTLMRSLYANYKPTAGQVWVRHAGRDIELTKATPRTVIDVRTRTLGYVSQFLRVIPRISTLDVVAEPLREIGIQLAEARERASALLARVNLPRHMWDIAPATFSGGEKQRVNIARAFIREYPIMLLDEPTASLDERNRDNVIELINEARERGSAIAGILHDAFVRDAVCTRAFDVSSFRPVGAPGTSGVSA